MGRRRFLTPAPARLMFSQRTLPGVIRGRPFLFGEHLDVIHVLTTIHQLVAYLLAPFSGKNWLKKAVILEPKQPKITPKWGNLIFVTH